MCRLFCIMILMVVVINGKPQGHSPTNTDDNVKPEHKENDENRSKSEVTIEEIPFYGGARGQVLEIRKNALGEIISERIVSKSADKIVPSDTTPESTIDIFGRSEFENELQKLYITAGNIMYLEQHAKQNGISLENDVQYQNNIHLLSDTIKKLSKLQVPIASASANVANDANEPKTYGLYYVPENNRAELRGVFKVPFRTKVRIEESEENKKKEEKEKEEGEEEEEEHKEEEKEDEDSEVVEGPAEEASVAEARPVAIAIAGYGGVADSKPTGVAVTGPKGLAVSRPMATAIAGVPPSQILLPVDTIKKQLIGQSFNSPDKKKKGNKKNNNSSNSTSNNTTTTSSNKKKPNGTSSDDIVENYSSYEEDDDDSIVSENNNNNYFQYESREPSFLNYNINSRIALNGQELSEKQDDEDLHGDTLIPIPGIFYHRI